LAKRDRNPTGLAKLAKRTLCHKWKWDIDASWREKDFATVRSVLE